MLGFRQPAARFDETARRSALVAGGTLISRVTGLLRIVVIGAVLGPTFFANSFITANVLPSQTYLLIAGQALALVVVPPVVRAIARGGTASAVSLMRRVSGFLLVASASVFGLFLLGSPLLAWILTFGIADPVLRGRAQELTFVLLLLVSPQVICYVVAALGAAAQQARQRFALAAAAPAVENLLLVGVVLLTGAVWGSGLEVGRVPVGLVLTLGIGSTLAVAAHACVQLVGAARAGLPLRPELRWRSDPETRAIARRLRGSVPVAAAPVAGMVALLVVAATVPGGVIVVQMAYLVFSLPNALGARAVSTVALPGMCAAVERGDPSAFASAWRRSFNYVTIIGLPPLLVLVFLAQPVADVLAYGELRAANRIDQLAACLTVIGLAQLAAGVYEIGRQALYARIDIAGAQRASVISLVVTFAVVASALLVPAGEPRLIAVCAALFTGEAAGASAVLGRLRPTLRACSERLVDGAGIAIVAAAAAAMIPVVVAGKWFLETQSAGQLGTIAALGACALLGLGIYALVLRKGMRLRIGRAS